MARAKVERGNYDLEEAAIASETSSNKEGFGLTVYTTGCASLGFWGEGKELATEV